MEQRPSENTVLLQVKDWRIAFPGEPGLVAVDGVGFELGRGQSLGLVGESGSGKSLTALSILRLLPKAAQASGNITWKGRSLMSLTEKEMNAVRGKEISMIFQEPLSSLNPVMRCGEQVAEGLRTHLSLSKQAAKAEVLQWLERVKLHDPERIWNSFPHELSGGQRQRVMIAMALATQPTLLIADEPTTALDVQVQRSILDLIRELREELGLSLLFISHDLAVVREVCESVLVMRHGKILEQGSVDTVFSQPTHPYTKGLLACHPRLDMRQHRLPTITDFDEHSDIDPASVIHQLAEPEIGRAHV